VNIIFKHSRTNVNNSIEPVKPKQSERLRLSAYFQVGEFFLVRGVLYLQIACPFLARDNVDRIQITKRRIAFKISVYKFLIYVYISLPKIKSPPHFCI